MVVRTDSCYVSVTVNIKLRVFYASLMGNTAGKLTVVVENIPFVIDLQNGVVSGPAENRLHYAAFVGKGPVGLFSLGIADIMSGAVRISLEGL